MFINIFMFLCPDQQILHHSNLKLKFDIVKIDRIQKYNYCDSADVNIRFLPDYY